MTEEDLKKIEERLKNLERHKVGHEHLTHKMKFLKRKISSMEAEIKILMMIADKKSPDKKEEKKDFVENISSLTIYNLGLSNRVINCLEYKNIRTAEELLSLSSIQLLNIPKLGQLSLDEINVALVECGLPQITRIKGIKPLSKQEAHRANMIRYKF